MNSRVLVIAVLLLCPTAGAGANDILASARDSAMAIESTDCVFEWGYHANLLVRFRSQEEMARLDIVFSPTAESDMANPTEIQAFNGQLYQNLMAGPGVRSLTITRQAPEGLESFFDSQTPIQVCYEWLRIASEDYHYDWATYRDQAVWDRLQPEPETLERTINGTQCVGLDFKWPNGTISRVFFDAEHGYFPVRSETIQTTGVRADLMEVSELAELTVDGRTVWFPARVSVQDSPREEIYPVIAKSYVVRLDSLRINEPIDPAIFTLPTTDLDIIFDRDVNEVLNLRTGETTRLDE